MSGLIHCLMAGSPLCRELYSWPLLPQSWAVLAREEALGIHNFPLAVSMNGTHWTVHRGCYTLDAYHSFGCWHAGQHTLVLESSTVDRAPWPELLSCFQVLAVGQWGACRVVTEGTETFFWIDIINIKSSMCVCVFNKCQRATFYFAYWKKDLDLIKKNLSWSGSCTHTVQGAQQECHTDSTRNKGLRVEVQKRLCNKWHFTGRGENAFSHPQFRTI